jgi:hopanoid C-3 methylase
MRILLIRPPVPEFTIGLKHIMICEPLELEYVAAGLDGHEVKIFDMILEKNLLKKLKEFQPDVVGLSCYITGVNEAVKLCREVKRWKQGCLIIVGGVHASLVPEDFSDISIDCIVLGDGTKKMQEVVTAYQNSLPLEKITGLAIPQPDNKVFYTPECNYMVHPDELPFPRRDLVSHLRHRYYYLFHQPVTLMKTTWGCWFKCNFCFNWKVTGGTPYARTPESIIKELETIDTREVYIVDDIFLINAKRLLKIAALIREKKIDKKYLVYSRADFICENEDVVKEWSSIGLSAVIIGLEASTDPELDSMNKNCTVDHNRKAVEILRKYGVDTYGSLIPGADYQTEHWNRLQKFIDKIGLYYINISPLTPMPGTDIWDNYKNEVTVSTRAHALWDLSHSVLKTALPRKEYYRKLLGIYRNTVLNIVRANKLTLRTRPPVFSYKYLRLWGGAFKIMFQFLNAHNHHNSKNIARAEYRGIEPEGLKWRQIRTAIPDKNIKSEVYSE